MAWNPIFDLFYLCWIFGPVARNGKHNSKKGSEKVLGRVLRKGSQEGFSGRVLKRVVRRGLAMVFFSKKSSERVLRRGS